MNGKSLIVKSLFLLLMIRSLLTFVAALAVSVFFTACNNQSAPKGQEGGNYSSQQHALISNPSPSKLVFKNSEGETGQATGSVEVGEIVAFVTGKFNSKDKVDTAYIIKTKAGYGNPVEDGVPDEYALRFTGNATAVKIGFCDARILNEGDLNGDGFEELSIFQYPENGTVCKFETFFNKEGLWTPIFDSRLIPTGGDPVPDADLQDKVMRGDGNVYYYETKDTTWNGVDTFMEVKVKVN